MKDKNKTIKFLQLNIGMGMFLDRVINFIKENDIDIVNLQEVSGGRVSQTKGLDCFKDLKKSLNACNGQLVPSWQIENDQSSYFGNAIFFKKEFILNKKEIFWLKEFREIPYYSSDIITDDTFPRNALLLRLDCFGKTIWIINTHLARGDNHKDNPIKLSQGKKLYAKVAQINEPFILSGDFNVTLDSQIISWFNNLSRNLTVENNIINTLNPKVHVAQQLFPKGLAVDYIFPSKNIRVKSFRLVDEVDLSDHFGLLLEFEL